MYSCCALDDWEGVLGTQSGGGRAISRWEPLQGCSLGVGWASAPLKARKKVQREVCAGGFKRGGPLTILAHVVLAHPTPALPGACNTARPGACTSHTTASLTSSRPSRMF